MIRLLCLLLLFSTLHAKDYRYQLSICTMFKDEAPYLREWIEYHRILGCEHFWLYNNNSSDNYLEVLLPYIDQGIVELVEWPSPHGKLWVDAQVYAYNDAMRRAKDQSKWLAVIDSDEFIVPRKGVADFKQTLANFEKVKNCGGLILFWHMYGTSHIYDLLPGQLQIEALLYRAPIDYPPNHHVKTICRPDRVSYYSIHIAHYKEPYRHYTISKGGEVDLPVQPGPVETSIHINHYWTRTERYMENFKIPRRVLCDNRPYTKEELHSFKVDLNQEYDDAILQYVPTLKSRLQ